MIALTQRKHNAFPSPPNRTARSWLLAAVLSSGSTLTGSAAAQVNEAFADLSGEIETVRSMAQTERKGVVADNMPLTASESQAFWPLYNQYRYDVSRVEDRLVRIVTDFAAHYDSLDDAEAKKLVDQYLDVQDSLLKLRRQYAKRFAQVLPGTKLMRYFQIEHKLDAVTELELAQIPLAQTAE
jgi:hypothetical protein